MHRGTKKSNPVPGKDLVCFCKIDADDDLVRLSDDVSGYQRGFQTDALYLAVIGRQEIVGRSRYRPLRSGLAVLIGNVEEAAEKDTGNPLHAGKISR